MVVLDASVIINLNASGFAREILAALSERFLVTTNAVEELRRGDDSGHDDRKKLDTLIAVGSIALAELDDEAYVVYESLIDEGRGFSLDDGEAATIAAGAVWGACVVIDERKARRHCRDDFGTMTVLSSAELFLHSAIAREIGADAQREAVIRALQIGRMRVPPECVDSIVSLIGLDLAAECPSLPRSARPELRVPLPLPPVEA